VERGNRQLFARRLTSGLDLLWPNAPKGMAEGFAAMSAWFGAERATAIRLGKDVKRYGPQPPLWAETSPRTAFTLGGASLAPPWTPSLQMQAFPSHHLYRLEVRGLVVWEFDDWPAAWTRNWPGSNQRQ